MIPLPPWTQLTASPRHRALHWGTRTWGEVLGRESKREELIPVQEEHTNPNNSKPPGKADAREVIDTANSWETVPEVTELEDSTEQFTQKVFQRGKEMNRSTGSRGGWRGRLYKVASRLSRSGDVD